MIRFAQLLAVVLVVALLLTEGLPWLQKVLAKSPRSSARSTSVADSPAAAEDCLSAAQRAADSVGDRARVLAPTLDEAALAETLAAIEDDVFEAEGECGCPGIVCRRAGEALAQLRGLVRDLSAGNPWGNPANRLEQAYRLLEEARAAASDAR